MVGTGSCKVAVGGVNDGTRGGLISNLADMLGDGGDRMGGDEFSVEASNTTCA